MLLILAALATAHAEPLPYKSARGVETHLTPRWAFEGGSLSADQMNTLIAELKASELRFDTSRFVGSRVRIYLAMPPVVKGLRGLNGLRVEWATRGQFQSGSVSPGARTLIFEGLATTRELTETFDFTLLIDARQKQGTLGFDPRFEIEVVGK